MDLDTIKKIMFITENLQSKLEARMQQYDTLDNLRFNNYKIMLDTITQDIKSSNEDK